MHLSIIIGLTLTFYDSLLVILLFGLMSLNKPRFLLLLVQPSQIFVMIHYILISVDWYDCSLMQYLTGEKHTRKSIITLFSGKDGIKCLRYLYITRWCYPYTQDLSFSHTHIPSTLTLYRVYIIYVGM